jgi:hypothetical protein
LSQAVFVGRRGVAGLVSRGKFRDDRAANRERPMLFVTIAYFLSSVAVGGAKILAGETASGVAFLAAALFGFWAGSGIKIALYAPSKRPRVIALVLAAAFSSLAFLITILSGVRFEAYGQDLHGSAWVVAGLIAGIMGTRRRMKGKPI